MQAAWVQQRNEPISFREQAVRWNFSDPGMPVLRLNILFVFITLDVDI
jgi:hypothetical protein